MEESTDVSRVTAPVDHEKLRRDIAEARKTSPEKIAAICEQLGITPNRSRRVR